MTVTAGLLLTISIIFLKWAMLIGGVALFLGRNILIKKLEDIARHRHTKDRVMVPNENERFL